MHRNSALFLTWILALAVLIPRPATGQMPDSTQEMTREELARALSYDLAELQSIVNDPQLYSDGPRGEEWGIVHNDRYFEQPLIWDIWDRALRKALEIQEKWENNPYVEVEGFNVTVGTAMSTTVRLRFKKEADGSGG